VLDVPIIRMSVNTPEIVEAARRGDRAALEALYRHLAPAVLGYLRAQGARDAEDLASETFVGVVRGLSRFRGDERAFRSWVFGICHRRLIDERRRLARHREEPTSPDDLPERRGGNVEEEAMARLGSTWARELVARLTGDQRDVLLLRILADLPIEDVGRLLGKSRGAVKSLQRRALLALARQVDRQGVS
jgi:RNA polymerase sigma factor (sigma-70 family)